MKRILHVNHHEGQGKLEGFFRLAHLTGYDGVELRRAYRHPDLTTDQYRERVAAEKQAHPDFEFVFGGGIDFHAENEDEIKREVDEYIEFLAWAAAACGTRQINFMTGSMVRPGADYMEFERNGSSMATEFHYERSSRWLRVVGEAAAKLGLKVALETHNCYIHDLAAPCVRLLELTGHEAIGINYDFGNIRINRNGESLDESMRILRPHITYVHLKNMLVSSLNPRIWMGCHLDQGSINNAYMLETLRDWSYPGMICVEYPSSGDGYYSARRAMDYLVFLYDFLGIG